MISHRALWVCLLCVALSFEAGSCAAPKDAAKVALAKVSQENTTMTTSIPFRIVVRVDSGKRLEAVLENTSQVEQIYLIRSLIQPSRLLIRTRDGKELQAFDKRTTMKFDNTAYRAMFKTLRPGETAAIDSSTFKPDSKGGYSISWGPFTYENLPAGEYSVRVDWTSAITEAYDADTRSWEDIENLWLGTVISNEVQIQLK